MHAASQTDLDFDFDLERDREAFFERLLLMLFLLTAFDLEGLRLLLLESLATGDPRFDPRGDLDTLRSTSLMVDDEVFFSCV